MNDPNWGWDIIELFEYGASSNSNPEDEKCEKTLTFENECYKSWAINYALWGWINHLCEKSYEFAKLKVEAYRKSGVSIDSSEHEKPEFGTQTRVDWTAFGYLGLHVEYDIAEYNPPSSWLDFHKRGSAEETWQKTLSRYSTECTPSSIKYKGLLTARLRISMTEHLFIKSNGESKIESTSSTYGRARNPKPSK